MAMMVSICVLSLMLCLASFSSISAMTTRTLILPSTSTGPESLAFDRLGGGPYTGISDGRIMKYENSAFVEFGFTNPTRSKSNCDGTTDPAKGPICGRPLGLAFYYQIEQLYIADAYRGLLVQEPTERLASLIANSSDGVPFRFSDGLDVDQHTGKVFFTDDASSIYTLSQIGDAVIRADATGRLLQYNPNTEQVRVLLKGLSLPMGVAVSLSGSFVLVSEYSANRIQKYWFSGPQTCLKLAGVDRGEEEGVE